MEDYYSILGCSENSSFEEIKKRYQELALKYHPDKAALNDHTDRSHFLLINEAWNILKEPESRKKYSADLQRLQLSEEPPLFATLNIGDIKLVDKVYSYPCRCGGHYVIAQEEKLPPECLVECDECSFNILIKS